MDKRESLDALRWYMTIADTQRNEMTYYHRDNPGDRGLGDPDDREHFARVAAWYAALYVVLEGWITFIAEPSPVLDELCSESPERIKMLQRFRNKTFHAQAKYPNQHLLDYISDEESVRWAFRLDSALTRAIHNVEKRLD